MNRNQTNKIFTVLGIVFLAAAIASYFYYQTKSISEHYQWTLITYPYRQYAILFFPVGIALLFVSALLPERKISKTPEEPDKTVKELQEETQNRQKL